MQSNVDDFRFVLDKGFVHCQQVMGNELLVVNTARVSFGKHKTTFDDDDERLIQYLLRNDHMSPFRHVMIRFHIKAPEVVMRQWFKHVIGCEWTSTSSTPPFHAWNEISGRYIEMKDVYVPEIWRLQSKDKKQGSGEEIPKGSLISTLCSEKYQHAIMTMMECYQQLLENGVAKEQARLILPFSLYTETVWTASFQAVMNFIELRTDNHAQHEIQEFANAILSILQCKLPILIRAWDSKNAKHEK